MEPRAAVRIIECVLFSFSRSISLKWFKTIEFVSYEQYSLNEMNTKIFVHFIAWFNLFSMFEH